MQGREAVSPSRRPRQRQEERRAGGNQDLFGEFATQLVAVPIRELLIDDDRVWRITADACERLRAIVRLVDHISERRKNARERSARPFVRAGDEKDRKSTRLN